MTTSPNIEKLFLQYLENVGEDPRGFIGFLDTEILERCDTKALGERLKRGANILKNGLYFMDFGPGELEKGKTSARLQEAVNITFLKL
ncbi:MAG: hypothetical protein ACPK7O_00355 [Methanobacterium sp.]